MERIIDNEGRPIIFEPAHTVVSVTRAHGDVKMPEVCFNDSSIVIFIEPDYFEMLQPGARIVVPTGLIFYLTDNCSGMVFSLPHQTANLGLFVCPQPVVSGELLRIVVVNMGENNILLCGKMHIGHIMLQQTPKIQISEIRRYRVSR